MAKLNKQEVSAVASKLHRELSKAAEEKRNQAMKHYTPSERYSRAKALMERKEILSDERDRINSELEQLKEDINNTCSFWVYSNDSKEKVLNRILSEECELPDVPSIDELKDEVTIAAIDDSFNTSSYIESKIAEFK